MANILIVEDEKVLNEAYTLVLKKNGYKVVSVFNGEEALAESNRQEFDLILLDLRMPKMDGVQFLKKLNLSKKHSGTQVIIFSNYDDQSAVDEAVKQGASRYILKAWSSPNELVKVVGETINNKGG